jgi:hypothetical protein
MRLLFALALGLLARILIGVLLLVHPAWSETRCITSEEKTLGRPQTLCDNGTRAVSTDNRTLEHWATTVTKGRTPVCTVRMDPTTKQMRVRCR